MNKTTEKTFTVHSVHDYNTMVTLIKEMNGCILRVTTSSNNIEDSEVIRIHAQGEENHLLFAQFLFNKYKNKSRELEGIVK